MILENTSGIVKLM